MRLSETIKANFKQANILIIEDNEDHWAFISRAMKHCLSEIRPVWVKTADEALEILQKCSTQEWDMPKLILLDLYLPTRTDGWDLLQRIKSLPPLCNQIPVVMLSASCDPADISESYQNGGSSYLVKPTDFLGWLNYLNELRRYWWETVTLPPLHFSV